MQMVPMGPHYHPQDHLGCPQTNCVGVGTGEDAGKGEEEVRVCCEVKVLSEGHGLAHVSLTLETGRTHQIHKCCQH